MQAAHVPPPQFDVVVREEPQRALVVPRGELDLATVTRVDREIDALRSRGFTSVVLDLRELTFMDSTGVRMLVRLASKADLDGFTFSIIDAEGPVRRLLLLTQLRDRFTHADP
jgi:anti-anti-sigma factor